MFYKSSYESIAKVETANETFENMIFVLKLTVTGAVAQFIH